MYKMVIISYLFYESLNLSQLALINWGGGAYIRFYSILLYFIMILLHKEIREVAEALFDKATSAKEKNSASA